MSTASKLTKKQKKGVAFRNRKTGGKKKSADFEEGEGRDVPIAEDQDMAEVAGEEDGVEEKSERVDAGVKEGSKSKGKGKEKAKPEVAAAGEGAPGRTKRKREAATEVENDGEDVKPAGDAEIKPKSKRRKGDTGEALEGEEDGAKKSSSARRYILFLGNLKYTTSLEAIQAHFSACDPPPTIRLLTPKKAPHKSATAGPTKSKGCAFLEFKHQNALQQGIKLHHSTLDGRKVNVELTAGGGGKSETRLNKLKERNKGLDTQRRKRTTKPDAGEKKEVAPSRGAERQSATSGVMAAPAEKRTWTVGEVEETETHRGGKKHAKRRPRPKNFSTGTNAIPVG
ncbi:hypothetical protein CONPUDRAFT_115752 [Coniophora puteana RWD-64-598 SS2]|uniref:RRM domain-containing protein n=1 Tax=Coniophora puteana (strain RWD-64-598) TaxID=741705 RepID=A0A5M3N654_CONPW|nr:uncharacterized protein CONPUDRAFT_115752 [Coniophora puteana RWD-64-598 SS2]EIW86909.1 hypothetical protein CONPUDRAFT_115752 [Coniophora puteana RWD-64-598 SS2]